MLLNLFSIAISFYFARGGGGGHGGGGGGGHGGGGFGGGYGGGSSGSGSGGDGGFVFFIVLLLICYVIYKRLMKSQSKNAQPAGDVVWPSTDTEQAVSTIFYAFQKDWADNNPAAMQAYLTPAYFYNVNLMLTALRVAGRRNDMADVQLLSAEPLETTEKAIIVRVNGQARDSLIDTASGTVYYTDTSPFSEFWYFNHDGASWRLDNIRQVTEYENQLNPAIQSFAAANNYFYSGEWGWLLLPTHGQLFSKANFMTSAVNDHVIGVYKNCIIEFYTYLPDKAAPESHTIAQAFLPKSYGDIIVRRKHGFLNFTPRGMRHVSMEWPDFNKKYDVYATSLEQATSFELLNPSFMEKVEALPFELNIEVVDNVVYLYTGETLDNYDTMLDILYRAFKEMKL